MTDKFELAAVQKDLATAETELAKAKEKIVGYKGRLENEKTARIADRQELETLRKKLSAARKSTTSDTAAWVYRASTMSIAVLLGVLLVSIGTWTGAARLLLIVAGAALTFFSVLLVFKMSLAAQSKAVASFFGIFGTLWFVCTIGIGVLIVGLNLSSLEMVQEVTEKIKVVDNNKSPESKKRADPEEIDLDQAGVGAGENNLEEPSGAKETVTLKDAMEAYEQGKHTLAVSMYNQIIEHAEEYKLNEMKMSAINGLCVTLQKMGKAQETLKVVAKHRKWVEETFARPSEESIRFFIHDASALWASNLNSKAVAVLGKAVHLTDRHFKKNVKLRWEVISKLVANEITAGNLEGAVNTVNSHIAVVESRRPVDQEAIAVALGDMGGYLLDNAKYDEAIPYFEKATTIYKSSKTTSSLDSANMRLNYALALYYRGKKSESMDTLIRAKIIFDRELPEGHESRVAAESLMNRLSN